MISDTAAVVETRNGSFRVAVSGRADAPVLVLSNSLGTTLEMWDAQVKALSGDYCVVRYDTRGHGGSVVTQGPYTFDQLGDDVVAILDALSIERANFCGVSMGGHTGLWLGVNAAQRFDAIIVANSAAKIGTAEAWKTRADQVRAGGEKAMAELALTSPSRWFTEGFTASAPDVVAHAQSWVAGISPEGYASCCDALATSDLRGAIRDITVPTLIVAGEFDPVTTVVEGEAMQATISGAKLASVPASHLSNIEAPSEFNMAVAAFLG